MATRIYILNYGARDTRVVSVNNKEYAAKIAAGLQRLATVLSDPDTEFVPASEFRPADDDNTWIHISLVTEPTLPADRDEETDQTTYPARAQFNAHFYMKYITDEDELADGADELTDRIR